MSSKRLVTSGNSGCSSRVYLESSQIVQVANQRFTVAPAATLTRQNSPSQRAQLVRCRLRGRDARHLRDFRLFSSSLGDKGPQGPFLRRKQRRHNGYLEPNSGTQGEGRGEARGVVHVTAKETALVSDEHIVLLERPGSIQPNRIQDRVTKVTAGRATNADSGKNGLEVQILGESPDDAVALGETRASAENELQVALPDASECCDHSYGVPVLLHERRVDAQIGSYGFQKPAIRRCAQRSRTCRRSRSCAKCVP